MADGGLHHVLHDHELVESQPAVAVRVRHLPNPRELFVPQLVAHQVVVADVSAVQEAVAVPVHGQEQLLVADGLHGSYQRALIVLRRFEHGEVESGAAVRRGSGGAQALGELGVPEPVVAAYEVRVLLAVGDQRAAQGEGTVVELSALVDVGDVPDFEKHGIWEPGGAEEPPGRFAVECTETAPVAAQEDPA
ncbi:efflux RND transporter periplasmic adaptor subunit [Babesia caballi]|uniref:Efflux RND transporter periplasmic adaptor subunit n=1 Tax=Babesia caballi TaxID=5871 RepID=A0AAV4M3E3_BABCB|nr:efflux RND transporter periplasmic adaptor subunit [Babesia caballi]